MIWLQDSWRADFKCSRKSAAVLQRACWPVILVNFNMPLELRPRLKYATELGTIPGPAPVDFNSFLLPFVEECKQIIAP